MFLVHVPEILRFKPEARQALADSAWFFAQGLLGKCGEQMRLAVALRGISSYDRVLTGQYAPRNAEKWKLKPETYDGFNCDKQLIPWFAPESATQNRPRESVSQ